MNKVDKIALGTAKVGLPKYGFPSGATTPTSEAELAQFIIDALALGISRLDTSPRYVRSERIIGQALKSIGSRPFISSKIDNILTTKLPIEKHMYDSVHESLSNMNIPYLDLCYLHENQIELISNPTVQCVLVKLKNDGMVKQVGLSLYTEEECSYAMNLDFVDYIQVPINVLDTFLYRLIRQKRPDIKIVGRSLLLQGLLVNDGVDEAFRDRNGLLMEGVSYARQWAEKLNMTPIELALRFAFSVQNVDHFILGTTSLSNLKKSLDIYNAHPFPLEEFNEIESRASQSRAWTNPKNW